MSTEFRPLEERDFESLLAMAHSAWQFAYEGILDPSYMTDEVNRHYGARRLGELLPGIRSGRTFFDVAVENDRVVGLCCAGTTDKGVELHRLYLDPAALGRGLATELLARLELFVKANRAQAYFCNVHKDNARGKQFYLKHGFLHLARQDTDEDWRMARVVASGMTGSLVRLKLRLLNS